MRFFAHILVTSQFDTYSIDIFNVNMAKLCYLLILRLITRSSSVRKRILDLLNLDRIIWEEKYVESAMVTLFF